MSIYFKFKKMLAAAIIVFAASLPLGQAQAASPECGAARAVATVLLIIYQSECLRNGNIVCSNARLTFHYNRITPARARAARLCL